MVTPRTLVTTFIVCLILVRELVRNRNIMDCGFTDVEVKM